MVMSAPIRRKSSHHVDMVRGAPKKRKTPPHCPLRSESNHSDAMSDSNAASASRHLRRDDGTATTKPCCATVSFAMTYAVMNVASSNHATTTIQATTSLPSVMLVGLVSQTSQPATGTLLGELAFAQHELAVDQHVFDADRCLVRLLERGAIDHRLWIETRDVGKHARLHQAAIGEPHAGRGERRHLAHG